MRWMPSDLVVGYLDPVGSANYSLTYKKSELELWPTGASGGQVRFSLPLGQVDGFAVARTTSQHKGAANDARTSRRVVSDSYSGALASL